MDFQNSIRKVFYSYHALSLNSFLASIAREGRIELLQICIKCM